MRRLKLLGLMCLALFAMASVMSSSSSALVLPEILPLVEGRTWTGVKDGKENAVLETKAGSKITCEAATAKGTEEAKKPLGEFTIAFEKCTTEAGGKKIACNSEGDAEGIILSGGKWHLVFDKLTTELLVATVFLTNLVLIKCTALVTIDVLAGQVICLDLEPTVKALTHLFHCTQKGGAADEKEWFNCEDKVGNTCKAALLCSTNKAAEEECSELALGSQTYKEEVFADI